jgi:hypothetical protein
MALNILFGRALAHFRLEHYDQAAEVLEDIQRYNRHAIELLSADNPRPVKPGREGDVDPGSRGEAWQYRALMRDQWRATPGALAWLSAYR